MKIKTNHFGFSILNLLLFFTLLICNAHAETVEKIIKVGEKRIEESKASQLAIEKLDDAKLDLLSVYKQTSKVVDGLKVYNQLLQIQVNDQLQQISELTTSIDEVALIERQIVPLMVKMIHSLEEFVRLDVPFLMDERNDRVTNLTLLLERSDVTVAEKFRRVLEAFQIEIDYGKTLKAYRGTLALGGSERDVDFLRVGRVAFLYQTLNGTESGAWNNATRKWETLSGPKYRIATTKALRIAKKQIAPDLLILPIATVEGEK